MALQQSITLPNSAAGNYVRLCAYRWDRLTREASCHFLLFANSAAASAAPSAPLCLVAVLRLSGAKFDQYLANSVLDANGVTVASQLYQAAKAEPLIAGGGLTSIDLSSAVDV